jgi:hypothetical protein
VRHPRLLCPAEARPVTVARVQSWLASGGKSPREQVVKARLRGTAATILGTSRIGWCKVSDFARTSIVYTPPAHSAVHS